MRQSEEPCLSIAVSIMISSQPSNQHIHPSWLALLSPLSYHLNSCQALFFPFFSFWILSFSHAEFLLVPTFPSGCVLSAAQLGQAAPKVVTAAASHGDISLMIVFKPTVVSTKDGLFTRSVETRSAIKVQIGGFWLFSVFFFCFYIIAPSPSVLFCLIRGCPSWRRQRRGCWTGTRQR